jgi:hypothetical protein
MGLWKRCQDRVSRDHREPRAGRDVCDGAELGIGNLDQPVGLNRRWLMHEQVVWHDRKSKAVDESGRQTESVRRRLI